MLGLSVGEFGLQEPGCTGWSSGPCSSRRAREKLQEGPVSAPLPSSSPPTSLAVTIGQKKGVEPSWPHEPPQGWVPHSLPRKVKS